MRTHISLPDEVVKEIDEVAGPRGRSAFIEEAVRLKLINERQKKALRGDVGLKGDYPYWATAELTSKWVHDMWQADQAYLDTRRAEREAERRRYASEHGA